MNKENEVCVPAEDPNATDVVSVPTAIGASATQFEISRNWCMNCTAIHAPYRARDRNNNEVPVCRNCYNKIRVMEEYPTANRANRRSIQKQLKKDRRVL